MNHLAHLFLAGRSAESLIGNLAGDFVKGPLGERFTPGIRAGIMGHRKIDAFTDSHPAVAAFRRVLIPDHGHYARVIADMFFDHFLAGDFERWSGEPLPAFLSRTFETIDPHAEGLPDRLKEIYPHMRDGRWFASYARVEGIERALAAISRRFSRTVDLAPAARHLVDSRTELERRFLEFFPDVVRYGKGVNGWE
ncbi:MAG: ACP phosphodiesterase [Thermoanaerobaculia bacterium]